MQIQSSLLSLFTAGRQKENSAANDLATTAQSQQNLPQQPVSLPDAGQDFQFPASEQERRELVRQAATYYAAQMPVGDLKFTIFRDADGQLITRFRNMIDGTVTEIPEPRLVPSYVRNVLGQQNLVNLVS